MGVNGLEVGKTLASAQCVEPSLIKDHTELNPLNPNKWPNVVEAFGPKVVVESRPKNNVPDENRVQKPKILVASGQSCFTDSGSTQSINPILNNDALALDSNLCCFEPIENEKCCDSISNSDAIPNSSHTKFLPESSRHGRGCSAARAKSVSKKLKERQEKSHSFKEFISDIVSEEDMEAEKRDLRNKGNIGIQILTAIQRKEEAIETIKLGKELGIVPAGSELELINNLIELEESAQELRGKDKESKDGVN